MDALIGFIVGLFMGTFLGVCVTALAAMAGKEDEE